MTDKPNTARKSASLVQPTGRTQKAVSFLSETPAASEPVAQEKPTNTKRATLFYMAINEISQNVDVPTKRLNVEIPLELHNYLNSFVRSSSDYGSLTELTIDLLNAFAKEQGFKPKRFQSEK